MTTRRNLTLGIIAVVLVATFVVGQLTGDDGANERLFASGPGTSTQVSLGRSGTTTTPASGGTVTTTVPGAAGGGVASTGAGAATSTTAAAPAGGGAGAGPSPGSSARADAPGRVNGVDGGLAGTGGDPSAGRGDGGAGSGASPSSTSSTTLATGGSVPVPSSVSLTRDDNGKTFTVKPDDFILITLDPVPGAQWSEPSSSGAAVTRLATTTLEGVLTASFTAAAAGTATVSAASTPSCTTANPPCLATSTGFSVTINVTP